MQYIDMETWERKEYFESYLDNDFPYINIGAPIDISNLVKQTRKRGLSSYLTLVHTAHRTAESLVNFRYRIRDGKPVINERMALSFTYLRPGSELFVNVTVDPPGDLREFQREAQAQIERQGTDLGLKVLRGRLDIVMYSAVPWVQYTHFQRTLIRAGVDSNPKISWGKYFEQDGRTLVTLSVQVHHGLMDGYHVGLFYEGLQTRLNGLTL
jgi:chloramphenicol O-acetyltransferase type A